MEPVLTIGMAVYRDFDGVYFTLQALRLYQDLSDVELLVVDNYGCDATRDLVEHWTGGRYLRFTEATGTSAPRDEVFRAARGEAVLCVDSHVLLVPGVVERLKRYYQSHPQTLDLLQGPLVYDDLRTLASHFEPVWRDGMWGIWAVDDRAEDPESEPFEIPMQGLGLFSCRKAAWPGFNPHFRGFGGEEGYIHQKFRNLGRRCLCLPWLRWVHRFGRPGGVPYRLDLRDRIVNYLIGHRELGLDEGPVLEHFRSRVSAPVLQEVLAQADQLMPRAVSADTPAARCSLSVPERVPAEVRSPELVSCLMPTYNRVPHHGWLLQEAVESFLRQHHPNKELLILNDTPGQTLECLRPGVTVINLPARLPDLGSKVAYLIERARGDVFCRWDDDDISLPWRIRLSLARLGNRLYWRPTTYWFDDGRLCFPEQSGYCHNAGIFRRVLLTRIGGYPAGYGETDAEDELFNTAAARHHLEVAEDLLAREHFYIYRWNTGSPHLSGLGCTGAAWRRRGKEAITQGNFSIEPRWYRNYVNDARRAAVASAPAAWDTVSGHFDFEPLYRRVLAELPARATVVEVGCWLGRSIIFLAQAARQAGKRLRLYAVDNGTGIGGPTLDIGVLRRNLVACGVDQDVRLLIMDSMDAAELFADASLPFVFIDGAHDYHNVRSDLQAWWPKIRKGGLLAGHDYTYHHPEVGQAVDAFFGVPAESLRSSLAGSCWQARKE